MSLSIRVVLESRERRCDGALNAIFAGPYDHALSGSAVLNAAETDLTEKFHSGSGEFFEVSSTIPCSSTGAPA